MIALTWLTFLSAAHQEQLFDVFLSAFLSQGRLSEERIVSYYRDKIIPRLNTMPTLCVAMKDDKIVGFSIFEGWDSETYYLAEMAVSPLFQGKGIGKQLSFSILEKDPTAKKIILMTEWDNYPTHSFYEKAGFCRSSFVHPNYPNGYIGYEYLGKR